MMEDWKGVVISLVASLEAKLALFLFLAALCSQAGAAEFCASTNTGSSFQPGRNWSRPVFTNFPVYSVYQSVGACSVTCRGYAFAIIQGHVVS